MQSVSETTDTGRARLACTSIIGGIGHADRTVETTGLDVTIRSRPHESVEAGGDVHFVSACASGRITRVVLADVAGHGAAAADRAAYLRTAVTNSVNRVRNTTMVKRTNAAFVQGGGDGRFATAVFVSYFQPTHTLRICNAGHPPPIHFDRAAGRWATVDDPERNLPLGIGADQSFRDAESMLEPGDAVLLVTDGLVESRDAEGTLLRTQGLVEWLGDREPSPQLVADLDEFVRGRSAGVIDDDLTVILLTPNGNRVSLKDNLLAPIRWARGRVDEGGTDATGSDGSGSSPA